MRLAVEVLLGRSAGVFKANKVPSVGGRSLEVSAKNAADQFARYDARASKGSPVAGDRHGERGGRSKEVGVGRDVLRGQAKRGRHVRKGASKGGLDPDVLGFDRVNVQGPLFQGELVDIKVSVTRMHLAGNNRGAADGLVHKVGDAPGHHSVTVVGIRSTWLNELGR